MPVEIPRQAGVRQMRWKSRRRLVRNDQAGVAEPTNSSDQGSAFSLAALLLFPEADEMIGQS